MREPEGVSLRDSLNSIFRRLYILKIVVVVLPLSTLLACYVIPPVFQSNAKVLVTAKDERAGLLLTSPQASGAAHVSLNVEELDLNSAMEILMSHDLWTQAVTKLGLEFFEREAKPGILQQLRSQVSEWINEVFGSDKKPDRTMTTEDKARERARRLLAGCKVVPVPKSKVLEVSFRYDDAAKAQQILATVLDLYLPYHLEVYSLPEAKSFFLGLGMQYKKEFEEADNRLAEFKKTWQIAFPEKQKESLISQIGLIRDSLVDIYAGIKQYQSMLDMFHKDVVPTGQLVMAGGTSRESTVITVLASQLLRARQSKLEVQEKFHRETRNYRDADAMVNDLKAEFKQTLESELATLDAKRRALETGLQQKQQDLGQLEEKAQEAERMALESTLAKERYIQYSTKAEEAGLDTSRQGRQIGNVRVVSKPYFPESPVFPNKTLFLAAALVLAFPLGFGIIMIANFLDNTFDTPHELESVTGYKVLASFRKLPVSSPELS
ncbi:MAG: GNVR domain-containing protein [Thermodesulfobacteriota bacterium]